MTELGIGSAAPAFDLPGTDGRKHSLRDFASSNALVVVFNANHCMRSTMWEDRIVAIAREYADRGIGMVWISSNDAVEYPEDSFEEMKKRAEAKNFPFPYLYDESQDVARAYGVEVTPEIFVFDASRKLRYHGLVDDNSRDESKVKVRYLRLALDAVLAGREVVITSTPAFGCTIKWKQVSARLSRDR